MMGSFRFDIAPFPGKRTRQFWFGITPAPGQDRVCGSALAGLPLPKALGWMAKKLSTRPMTDQPFELFMADIEQWPRALAEHGIARLRDQLVGAGFEDRSTI